ncbi:hypothetical protein INS49_001539 [Diaporthe citri]|uniref:uncharacterized protein n=1 Tax=Diaporthe citri TaxID=83186 RepID=UPI001C813096|nr:uncharacterized protein INS49_001539 [Diaporthe citri]KAG6367351.1 hypothetical protein INS49_001539 [Diaporthe citri]
MHSAHILKLLVAALSANTVTQGFIIDAAILGRNGVELARRQGLVGDALNNAADAVTGSGGAAATTTTEDSTPTTATTAAETTSTTSKETTSTSTSQDAATTSTSENAPTPTTTSTDDTPTSTSAGGSASPTASSETTSGGGSSSATTTAEPVTSTAVVVVTATDGSVSSSTSVSVSTPTPGLSEANNSGSSSGMSDQTRKTIIGVVVGVGGAIVLAVGGLFAWRIWGRKKANEENDGLMSYNNGAEGKSEVGGLNAGSIQAGGARSPFQSTLESYHAPSNVNASSNF